MSSIRNPKWNRDELILALELYQRVNLSSISAQHEEIEALSKLLNVLPIFPLSERHSNFRNANGVYMKLQNLRRFDSDYLGKGLPAGGKLEKEIWNEFAYNKDRLKETASAIKANAYSIPPPHDLDEALSDEEEEFPEGRILTQLHKRRERNGNAPKRKKQIVLAKTGSLSCEVCNFDFYKVYGGLGYGFAECHHVVPLSRLNPSAITNIKDLAIVCANCHRMLHRMRPWKTIEELRLHLEVNQL